MNAGLVVLAAAGLAGVAAAQAGLPGALTTIDGRTIAGALRIDGDAATIATATGALALAAAELLAFEPVDAVAAPIAAPHRLWLRSGLELPCVAFAAGKTAAGPASSLRCALPCGVELELPLSAVRALRQGGGDRPEPALFAADLRTPRASDDLLFVVKDGRAQRSAVTVHGLAGDRLEFALRGDAYDFEWSGVAAIVFARDRGFAPDRQPKPRARLLLTTGEQLEGRLLALDARSMRCRLDEGVEVELPAAKLLSLQVASDRLVWLTELSPKVVQTPAFDRVWPILAGRSPAGPGLLLGGKTFARGLCVVPRARLTYELDGRFDWFEASIGIDDRAGPEAHAIFRVFIDDHLAYESAPRTRGLPPETLRLPLANARILELEVDFGKNFDLGDYCVWADARVVQR